MKIYFLYKNDDISQFFLQNKCISYHQNRLILIKIIDITNYKLKC